MSVSELAHSVSETIQQLVLPEIPRTSWASGYLHSALILLASIEANANTERDLSIEDISEVSALLIDARRLLSDTPGCVGVFEVDPGTLMSERQLSGACNDEIEAHRERLTGDLNRLIVWTYENKKGAAKTHATTLLEIFRRYREHVIKRGMALTTATAGKAIF